MSLVETQLQMKFCNKLEKTKLFAKQQLLNNNLIFSLLQLFPQRIMKLVF